jgi:hypothetical protein
MTRKQLLTTAAAITIIVAVTTWPFRSERLISWDAANFAFALQKIDIATHRPHPPGYLGYVFAGRALSPLFPDANTALTAWNVIVRSAAGLLIVLLAFSATDGSIRAAMASAAILLTSPLLWFYASNAEIYPSEMALSLAVGYGASEALKGRDRAIYWTLGVLALTALFKISATLLMGPAALYAWSRSKPEARGRSILLFAALLGGVGTIFYIIQPDFLTLLWGQFSGATAASRMVGGSAGDVGLHFNRNIRDTFTSLLAALGLVNATAFLIWLVADRRLPAAIDRRLVVLWTAPWFVLLILVHIGNPGYVLPLLPIACLIIGASYARRSTVVFISLVTLQAGVNLAQAALFVPSVTPPGTPIVRYRDKTLLQRMASDLQPLTFPTRATIRRSDAAVNHLLSLASDCIGGTWVVVAGAEPVDWRRASYYLPRATAIRLSGDDLPEYIGHGGDFVHVSPDPAPIASTCGLLWMSNAVSLAALPAGGRHIEELGWVFPPGSGQVSSAGVTWSWP